MYTITAKNLVYLMQVCAIMVYQPSTHTRTKNAPSARVSYYQRVVVEAFTKLNYREKIKTENGYCLDIINYRTSINKALEQS